MKIAFATTDRVNINAHFGWVQEMDVYEVSESGHEFLKTIHFDSESKKEETESIAVEAEPDRSEGNCKHGKSDCKKNKDEPLAINLLTSLPRHSK